MSTAILTDTNSGIYAEEAAKLGIFVIPTPIIIDGKTYFEGETISHGDFFQRLEEGASVHTSQPSPESVKKMWDQILADYDDLVYIPLSSGLSGSAQTARLLAGEYGGRVQVADNHRISVTMRQSVEDARAMVSRGLSAPEIRAELERMAFDSTIFLGVETLKYLKNGGRVTPAAAAVATILNIKPVCDSPRHDELPEERDRGDAEGGGRIQEERPQNPRRGRGKLRESRGCGGVEKTGGGRISGGGALRSALPRGLRPHRAGFLRHGHQRLLGGLNGQSGSDSSSITRQMSESRFSCMSPFIQSSRHPDRTD